MRVIVLNQSSPLRQVIDFIAERGVNIDVAAETTRIDALPALVREHGPDYLFSLQTTYEQSPKAVEMLLAEHPTLAVALFNEAGQEVLFKANKLPAHTGATGREKPVDAHALSDVRTTLPHSPAQQPRPAYEPNAAAAVASTDDASTQQAATADWRSYTLSDFIYLMTEDKPETNSSGGITDVPHDEQRAESHPRR